VNLLYTTCTGYNAHRAQHNISEWKSRHHIVEFMPAERLQSYLRFDISSSLALVDAIVCSADSEPIFGDPNNPELNYALDHAILLSSAVRELPERCAMRDGRKWRSIPFIIFYLNNAQTHFGSGHVW
jgi:hypothetical protein